MSLQVLSNVDVITKKEPEGVTSSSDDSDKEEVVNEKEKEKEGSLSSFSLLEESLPLKRGLSSFFSGKSRSFGNLSSCENSNVEELAKPENPFNKRQRILTSLSRRASCGSIISNAMPSDLIMSPQDAVKEENENEKEEGGGIRTNPPIPPRRKTKNGAKFRASEGFIN